MTQRHPHRRTIAAIEAHDDAPQLRRIFTGPEWLRDAGGVAWLIVGIVLVVVGAVVLLSLTQAIVMPLITAFVVASVGAPVVGWLQGHRIPRAAGTALLLLLLVLIVAAIFVIVLGGVTSQLADIKDILRAASDKIAKALRELGVGDQTAADAQVKASSDVSSLASTLLHGLAGGLSAVGSLVGYLSLTLLSLFFILKDGPTLRAWVERNAGGLPPATAHTIVEEMLRALRGYFGGVTAVAAFNAVVIGLGALVIGVPLAGTIAIVTFVGAYIPYIGAWTAGVFAVLLALGQGGPGDAVAMGIVALLANGALQQIVQPFAFGAALGLHPLAVLIVTIAGGSLFGMIGLVLAAPVTSAIVRISSELRSGSPPVASAPR